MTTKLTLLATSTLAAMALALPGIAGANATNESASMTQTSEAAPLISREALFGNPTKAAGQISPDGKWISWLAPSNGVLNVWLAPADDLDAAWPSELLSEARSSLPAEPEMAPPGLLSDDRTGLPALPEQPRVSESRLIAEPAFISEKRRCSRRP